MDRPSDKWLVLGVGLVVALMLVNAGVAYRNTRQLHGDAYWVAHSQQALDALSRLLSTMKDAETGQRGFLLTGDERYLRPYDDALAALDARVEAVRRLTGENDRQQARIPGCKSSSRQNWTNSPAPSACGGDRGSKPHSRRS